MTIDPVLELKRNYVNTILRIMSIIGFIAYIPSMYLSLTAGLWIIAILDTAAYVAVLAITVFNKIPMTAKLVTLLSITFILSVALFVFTGPFGAGIIFLFAFVFLTAVFFPVRITVLANLLAILTLGVFTLLTGLHILAWEQHIETMIVLIANFALVSFIFSHGLSFLMTKLRLHIQKQAQMTEELHHRVKNNIQVISSLVNLQTMRETAENSELARLKERLTAISMVHLLLYTDDRISVLSLQKVLGFILDKLFTSLKTGKIRFQRDINVAQLQISADQATLISLVLSEIVSNAARHGFPGDRTGAITVSANAEPGRLRMVIRDDGIGLDGGNEAKQNGLGMEIINTLLEQLKAKYTVEKTAGTCYDISIPLA